jgi:transaldolase
MFISTTRIRLGQRPIDSALTIWETTNVTIPLSDMSPLLRTVRTTPTDVWNDSCAAKELEYALANGAVGATTNPAIVLAVLRKEFDVWKPKLRQLIADNPTANEEAIAWKLIEEMGLRGAEMLLPVFERERGLKGRLSMQTNPVNYMDASKLVEHAVHLSGLARNIQVKIPVTAAGVAAIEEATRLGVNINATVNFTLPQAIAVAEAVERGLDRRAKEGHDVSAMRPVCTIMIGRTDDFLKLVAKRDAIVITPGHLDWGGIAVIKKAYGIFKARGYRARLLAAAYRHHMHWSELIGGDLILTIPHEWQVLFNNSDIEVKPRIDDAVDPAVIAELYRKFPDFRRAYDENGLSVAEFDRYGATIRTLRSFIEAYRDLTAVVRDAMLPPP